mgnify:CR=1 FL=1
MANSNTPHSKALRAQSSLASKRKKMENGTYKQFTFSGDASVIDRLICILDKTGQPTRIKQLESILDKIEKHAN